MTAECTLWGRPLRRASLFFSPVCFYKLSTVSQLCRTGSGVNVLRRKRRSSMLLNETKPRVGVRGSRDGQTSPAELLLLRGSRSAAAAAAERLKDAAFTCPLENRASLTIEVQSLVTISAHKVMRFPPEREDGNPLSSAVLLNTCNEICS